MTTIDEAVRGAFRSLRRVVDAGEPFVLEGLARLDCDAGDRPADALDLARRNLRFKRDPAALGLLRRAEAAMP